MKFWIPLTIILLAMTIALVNIFYFRPIPRPYLLATLDRQALSQLNFHANYFMKRYYQISAETPKEAEKLLQQIVNRYPGYLPARMALAQKDEEQGNSYQAYQQYFAILQNSPLDKKIEYKVAVLEVKLGDYSDAQRLLKDIIISTQGKLQSLAKQQTLVAINNDITLHHKMDEYQSLRKVNDDEAFKFIHFLSIKYPLNVSIQKMMAGHFLERNNIDQALYYFERAQAIDPENTDIAFVRGKVYYSQNDFAKALAALRLSSNSVDPETRIASKTLLLDIHNKVSAQKDKGL